MADFDKLLDLLDQGTQRPGDTAYPTDSDPALCWRCLAAPGKGKAEVCVACRTLLLDETYASPVLRDGFDWLAGPGVPTILRSDCITFTWTHPAYDESEWTTPDDPEAGDTPGMVFRRIMLESPNAAILGAAYFDDPSGDRAAFERGYAERSGLDVIGAYRLGIFPAILCDCRGEDCEGWRRRYADDGPA